MLPFIRIGDIRFPSYAIINMSGYLITLGIGLRICREKNISRGEFLSIYLFSTIGAIIGARLWFVAQTAMKGNLKPVKMMSIISTGGFSYMGAFLCGLIVAGICIRKLRQDIGYWANNLLFLFPLMLCFSKVACYFAGCCGGTLRVPIQIVESVAALILALVIYKYGKGKGRHTISLYVMVYCVYRFIIEFYRDESKMDVFTYNQYFIIGILISMCLWRLIILNKNLAMVSNRK